MLLDEVGLAEQSPHLPLKVLHKVLDEAGQMEAVVGISNWALDAAKMNRAVVLSRPDPDVDDLRRTGVAIVEGFGGASRDFAFATILGAGHEVPTFRPEAAFVMITRFRKGEPLAP